MTDRSLTIWTVYRSPSDYPGKWVLRAWDIVRGSPSAQPRHECDVADSLDEIRELLPPGLHCLGREHADDPVIYESWI